MKIKNRIIVFYLAIIIIPFIIVLTMSSVYMSNVKKEFEKEISSVIDQNSKNQIDRVEFISNTLKDYTDDGNLDDMEKETLRILFNRALKVPLIININDEEVFKTSWLTDNIDQSQLKNVEYINDNQDKISYSYIEIVRVKKTASVDIFRLYNGLISKVGAALFVVLSFFFIQFISRFFYKPLKSIENKVNSIKEGKISDPLNYTRKDEIGDVFLALNEMEKEINDSREFQREYEEKRNELLANISHDLKTPMTAIRGYVDGINDGVANTPEKLEKYMTIISSYVRDMDSLIDDLTLLSNLDIDINSMNFESVLFKEYIDDCTYELDFEMKEYGIEFDYSVNIASDSKVFMDRDKIKRVINNIITNAIKFTEKDMGKIEIKVDEDDNYICVSIRDNGLGIESGKVDKIFERFYRVDESRNSETGGSGLGLSIAKQIIEKHSGIIAANSEFGVYTDIYFKLKKV